MKILVLNPNIKGIGTYRRCFYFSRELARHGHEVTLMTVSKESKYRPRTYYKSDWVGVYDKPIGSAPWIKVVEGPSLGHKLLPGWGSGPLDISLRIREVMKSDYDVIYGFEYHPNVSWPVYITSAMNKKYRFLSDWCDWYAGHSNRLRDIKAAQKIDAYLEERIRFKAERVSVTSRVLLQRAISIGIPADRIRQISEGATPDYIYPQPIDVARRKLNLPAENQIIAAIHNGDMILEIKIFRQVLMKVPKALLLMIGRESPDAMAYAHNLGISSQIVATGWVSDEDYPKYLASADICICPLNNNLNDRARWPAKILDFLCAQRATVTNDIGEVGALFHKHEIGLLADFSIDDFAEKIVCLLNDEERRRYLAESGRRIMETELDYRIKGKEIEAFVNY